MALTDDNSGAGDAGTVDDILGGGGGTGGEGEAGGDAGAGAEGGAGGADGGDAGAGDPEFYAALSGEAGEGETASNRDYVKAKGFKDLDGLVKAYRSAEKGLHDSGRVKVPGEGASEAEIAEFHKAIGVPDDPKGYTVPEP